jgi:hypothetical protein
MVAKKLSIAYAVLCIGLIFFLSLQSTPITDDYCMALGVKNFGLIETAAYYNNAWTPSISYYFNLGWWYLPFSTLTNSLLVTCMSLGLSILFLNRAINIAIFGIDPKSKNFVKCILVILLLASLSLVQVSVYFNSSAARNLDPAGVIKDWFLANFTSIRDGQILLWAFSTPLTAPKVYLSAAVIYFVVALNDRKISNHRITYFSFQVIGLMLALLVGLTTESLLLIMFVFIRNLLNLKRSITRYREFLLMFSSIAGVAVSYFSPGSQNRTNSLSREGIAFYLSLFLGNVWQFFWMLALIFTTTLILYLFLIDRLGKNINFPKGLRENLRVLAASSLITQLAIETLVYPAAYHWFSLLLIFSLWFFVEIATIDFKVMSTLLFPKLTAISYLLLLLLLLNTILSTIGTASFRQSEWSMRSKVSISTNSPYLQNLPAVDNSGKEFAQDLQTAFPSIVPFYGVKENFTTFCYKKLPLGF